MATRPTPDRLRETLFNIIAGEVAGSIFIDAYAGTGAVGIEALSRGARHAIFVEKSKVAVGTIEQNLESLGIAARSRVVAGAAALHLSSLDADIVFLDPPYEKHREYIAAFEAIAVHPPKLLIVQHDIRFDPEGECGPLRRSRTVRHGENALSFYRIG